jgi:hypothetical protein
LLPDHSAVAGDGSIVANPAPLRNENVRGGAFLFLEIQS